MKLQVNLAGIWRDVVTFEAPDAERVKQAAATLADVTTNGAKWRLLTDAGDAVMLNVFTGHWQTFAELRA